MIFMDLKNGYVGYIENSKCSSDLNKIFKIIRLYKIKNTEEKYDLIFCDEEKTNNYIHDVFVTMEEKIKILEYNPNLFPRNIMKLTLNDDLNFNYIFELNKNKNSLCSILENGNIIMFYDNKITYLCKNSNEPRLFSKNINNHYRTMTELENNDLLFISYQDNSIIIDIYEINIINNEINLIENIVIIRSDYNINKSISGVIKVSSKIIFYFNNFACLIYDLKRKNKVEFLINEEIVKIVKVNNKEIMNIISFNIETNDLKYEIIYVIDENIKFMKNYDLFIKFE